MPRGSSVVSIRHLFFTLYHNFSILIRNLVLGVRANLRELARTFEKVYGKSVTLERHGSRDELYKHMHDLRSKNPQDIFSYMPLYVHVFPYMPSILPILSRLTRGPIVQVLLLLYD